MNKIFVYEELHPVIEAHPSLLSRNNVRLFTAPTAEEALEIHRAERMDLIVADLDMPRMGGDKLCLSIRQGGDALNKVYVMIACSGRKDELRRLEKCGANTYIKKPFDLPHLLEVMGGLLAIPRRRDLRVLVKVTVHGKFRSESFFCASRDISASGLLVETDKTLAKGDTITCSFFLPDTERIIVDGEVVRVIRGKLNTYSYGVRFLAVSDKARTEIARFIDMEG